MTKIYNVRSNGKIIIKWDASSRWSFGPISAWGSTMTTIIGRMHPSLFLTILKYAQNMFILEKFKRIPVTSATISFAFVNNVQFQTIDCVIRITQLVIEIKSNMPAFFSSKLKFTFCRKSGLKKHICSCL